MANDILRMSGMNSGLDTEAIVEAMTAATIPMALGPDL